MNVIDTIIERRHEVMSIAAEHGVIGLKLYGSVLIRTEKDESDIALVAVFDSSIPDEWDETSE